MNTTIRFLVFCSFVGLMLLSAGCKDDDNPAQPVQPATNPFIGSWKVVTFQGTPFSGDIVWTFMDTTLRCAYGSSSYNGAYTYKSDTIPAIINVSITGVSPDPNLAIYTFVPPDTLIIKFMRTASGRATNFNVENGYDLEALKKQ